MARFGSLLIVLHYLPAIMGYRSDHGTYSFNFPNTTSPQRFDINVTQDFIDLTLRKVLDYRPSRGLSSEWTIEGPPDSIMTSLAEYWATEYDWRETEAMINRFEHYATTVPGNRNYTAPVPLHFIHQRSNSKAATPILLLHGWTSSHLEWSSVIEHLMQHANQSFHIVAPDLPGNGFSPAPIGPGMGPREMGIAFDALMKQLGYSKYGVVGTDAGWAVGSWMVEDVYDSVIGFFTDFFYVPPTPLDLARQAINQTTQEENNHIAASTAWSSNHQTFSRTQTEKPLTLSLALSDSPVGMAGWMWDIKYAVSDGYPYSQEEIITDTMMLWTQEPYGGIRFYKELYTPETSKFPKTNVPTGVTQWGNINGPFATLAGFALTPRDWVERTARVVYWKRYEYGGHYPAVNHPDILARDVQEFFSRLV